MATILIYNLAPQKEARLKMLCRKWNIETRSVEKDEYGYTLGYLLGLSDDAAKYEGEDFDGEMLYISDLSGGMLSLFLDQLRRNKLVVPLKAIRTETNVGFTSCALYGELCAERDAIAKGMQAHTSDV